jgi:5-methylcytosine-specific restriction endonuclease McrA
LPLRGGACELCGYDRCLPALSFHHLDPATKRFNLGSAHTRSWASLLSEAARCVLVCENCHREVEHGIAEIPRQIKLRIERTLQGVERREPRRSGRPALS